MCGISGIIDKNIADKEKVVLGMTDKIFHRGPDQDGFFVDGLVGLGMRRLSIIDLSTGKQPITSADGKSMIFFNGEIYNYLELREELVKKGFQFKTHSDTEVILHMYESEGEKMLVRLRGMFTFCIYNTETKKIFLARDFFGIKPLYYLKNSESVTAFSSEIKSFLAIPGFEAKVNDDAVYNYLSFQYNPLPETFFKGVYKLLPGHFMEIDATSGVANIKKYWSYEIHQQKQLSRSDLDTEQEEKMARTVLDTVRDSVKYHMIADVPVGAFLSGGVDSSIIATMMQSIRGDKKIKTFTVGFDTLTEANEAKQTSDFLGTDHTEIKIGRDEYFSVLPKAVWHFDEPIADPSAIGLYFVSREARKHVTVVLSGEGADELFGGYNIYLAPYQYRKFSWLPKKLLKLVEYIPFEFWGKNYIRRAYRKLSDWYIGNASIFKPHERDILWKENPPRSGLGEKESSPRVTLGLEDLYEKVKDLSDSSQMQYIDIQTWLVGDILAKADKMTMAHSLELRVPFLDIEVAKLASSLPDNLKWRGGVTKYILRKAFEKIIPESTRNRKKLGFPTPVRDWFTADQTDIYDNILTNPYIMEKMNISHIQKLIDDHTEKRADNSRKIYLLLMLALWYDVYIRGKV